MTKSYEEMVREAEAVKDTEDELRGLVPVKARVSREARAVFAVRLSPAELSSITKAAEKRGRAVGDFIRTAALAAASGDLELGAGERAAVAAEVRDRLRELESIADRL